jgi:hypothetical protein
MVDVACEGNLLGPPVGYYGYTVAEDHWTWSEGVYAVLGFEPGEVPATTRTLLAHQHPDDRARAVGVLEAAIAGGGSFSCYHRVVDRLGRVRSVLAVGRTTCGEHGAVEEVVGSVVDLTELRRAEGEADLQQALRGVAEHRAVIEQAKGILMLVHGCDEDEAFAVLRQHSQNANIKVSDLAHRLVKSAGMDLLSSPETRRAVAGFLDTLR